MADEVSVYGTGFTFDLDDAQDAALLGGSFLDTIVYVTYPYVQTDEDAARQLRDHQEQFHRYPYYYAAAWLFRFRAELLNYANLPATICMEFNHGSWLCLNAFSPTLQADLERHKETLRRLLFEVAPTWRAQRQRQAVEAEVQRAQRRLRRLQREALA